LIAMAHLRCGRDLDHPDRRRARDVDLDDRSRGQPQEASRSRRGATKLLVYLAFPDVLGSRKFVLRNKHDRLHHGHPNVEGVDPDIKPFSVRVVDG